MAAWLRSALTGRPIEINGDGRQTRDFVHADDLAAAVQAALDAPEDDIAGELFQAGTGVETTVAGLAEAIVAAVEPVEVRHAPARPGDIGRNVAVDKAATVLGYRAVFAASGRARGDRRLVRRRARGPRARCSRGTPRQGSE